MERDCLWCTEPILPTDKTDRTRRWHRTCFLRSIVGSVAHLERRCSCYVPGSEEGDPPGLTRRKAANLAVRTAINLGRLSPDLFPECTRGDFDVDRSLS